MARRTALDNLNDTIAKILDQYSDETLESVKEIAEKMGKAGVKSLKKTSPRKTGKYAESWKMTQEDSRTGTKVIIYNEKPGLPHLLENGHQKRNGKGRVNGIVHIKPVEEELVEAFEKKVVDAL